MEESEQTEWGKGTGGKREEGSARGGSEGKRWNGEETRWVDGDVVHGRERRKQIIRLKKRNRWNGEENE